MNLTHKKLTPSKVVTYIVLCFWAVTTLYPFVWVILNSFREKGLIRKDSFSIPTAGNGFTLDNYATAMDRFDFGSAYLNSILVSVVVTIAVVILAGLCAYGLVRYRFRGRGLLYSLIMGRHDVPRLLHHHPRLPHGGRLGHRLHRQPLAQSSGGHPAADCG